MERKSNIELLRIISMCMILGLHYLNPTMGGGFGNIEKWSMNYYLAYFLECFCIIGVNCFVLITGYFSINSNKIKIGKAAILYALMLFYGLIFFGITVIITHTFSLESLIKTIAPFLFGRRWFVETYIILLLFIPFLNIVIHNISKKEFIFLLVIQTSLFSLWYSFLPSAPITDSGYGIINFITLYFLGAYCRMYLNIKKINRMILIFIWVVSIIGTICCLPLLSGRVLGYCFITNIIGAFSLFLIFLKLDFRTSRAINFLSSHAFSVYLIHSDFNITYILYHSILQCEKFYNNNIFIIHFIISIICIYLICVIIDYFREKSMGFIFKHSIFNFEILIGNVICKQ